MQKKEHGRNSAIPELAARDAYIFLVRFNAPPRNTDKVAAASPLTLGNEL